MAETSASIPDVALSPACTMSAISVANLEHALAFWEKFLGKPARWTTVLEGRI